LSYRGISEAVVQDGAQIAQFEWIQPPVKESSPGSSRLVLSIWETSKLAATTVIYFLIAMLMYKLAPAIFKRQSEVIGVKPLHVFGIGLIALLSVIVAILILAILLLLSIGVISIQIPLFFASAVSLGYMILFYLSTIPVSLWLGNLLFNDRYSIPYRCGAGLAFISTMLFLMNLFGKISGWGLLFGILSALCAFAVMVMGMGAILYGIRDIYTAIKRYET
jgi:hypothetical protein